jgi:hypothetical protein
VTTSVDDDAATNEREVKTFHECRCSDYFRYISLPEDETCVHSFTLGKFKGEGRLEGNAINVIGIFNWTLEIV